MADMAGASVLRLTERIAELSPRRQEIIRPVLENPRDFVLLSVRLIAKKLKTDPATMVRIVRGMHFESYREFQRYLHELSIAHATSLDTMQAHGAKEPGIPDQVRAALDQDLRNLNGLVHSLDLDRIIDLVARLYTARRILIMGGDLAGTLVDFLEHHLMILGLPVSGAKMSAHVVHKVRFLGKKDVVIAVSYRRCLRQTVEGLRTAREHGAFCVGVTDTYVSPIAQFANETFLTSVDTPSFGASYVAPMAFFNVLLAACANYKRSHTLALMKKVEDEQRHGFRWYQS